MRDFILEVRGLEEEGESFVSNTGLPLTEKEKMFLVKTASSSDDASLYEHILSYTQNKKTVAAQDEDEAVALAIASFASAQDDLAHESVNKAADVEPEFVKDINGLVKKLKPRIERYNKRYNFLIELEGNVQTLQVFLFGKEIKIEDSLKHQKFSPAGFGWGFLGNASYQLAYAICLEIMGPDKAIDVYRDFLNDHLLGLDMNDDFKIDIYLNY